MSLTIGRTTVTDPTSITHNGNQVRIGFNIYPGSVAEAKVRRQQVLGLADNDDEPVVPVTWTADSDYDGFYRVVSVDVEPHLAYLTNGLMQCAIDLERVGGGFVNPVFEMYATSATVTNSHSKTGLARVAFPQTGADFNEGDFGYNSAQIVQVEGGYVRWHIGTPPISGTSSYYTAPADFYIGAATIEVSVGGTWYKVSGRQLPKLSTAGGWRIANGLMRITPNFADPEYTYVVEYYDTGAWVTLVELERGSTTGTWAGYDFAVDNPSGTSIGGAASSGFVQPTILRNGPERATIKIPQILGYETVSLMRGASWVDGFIYYTAGDTGVRNGIGSLSAVACTDVTYGAERTSADGNGNKFFLATPSTNSVDTTNGRVTQDVKALTFQWMAGVATSLDGTYNEDFYAFAANSVTQRVVAR